MTEQANVSVRAVPPPLPLEQKDGTYSIEYTDVGPDFEYGRGKEFTDREYRMCLTYLELDRGTKCQLCGKELGRKAWGQFAGLVDGQPHHLFRRDETHRLHVNRYLLLACHTCNSHNGQPPIFGLPSPTVSQSDKERENIPDAQTRINVPTQIKISIDMWEWYERWIEKHIADDKRVSIDDCLNRATRESREKLGHGSQQALRGYLAALTSAGGKYTIKGQYVVRRNGA
jgi:hypothetical protein